MLRNNLVLEKKRRPLSQRKGRVKENHTGFFLQDTTKNYQTSQDDELTLAKFLTSK